MPYFDTEICGSLSIGLRGVIDPTVEPDPGNAGGGTYPASQRLDLAQFPPHHAPVSHH